MPFTKGTKRSAPREPRNDFGDEDEILTSKPTKKTKTSSKPADAETSGVDSSGNPFWDLSNKRRVNISQFNKATLVNIREFYEKDGELLPGKKVSSPSSPRTIVTASPVSADFLSPTHQGISLSVAQYEALVKAMPAINAKLRTLGHNVADAGGDDAGAAAVEAVPKPAAAKDAKSKAKRSNIEATSDEESE
ncbi:transcriptional Coactivator p15 [Colletotrichum sojae]|uniref:Transcriptional Coactivator p15 n=1 Tax=Colletotrichum sojae TaxID=2175907 RepID=A0A8H6MXC6_9PEZI|nr:transcriptional Coactivator p15 [Colletotrichum sojae]